MRVVEAAWICAGQPAPHSVIGGAQDACAACAQKTDDAVAVGSVVSKNFTDFDLWQLPSAAGVCVPCAWAYTERSLRTQPYEVSRAPSMQALSLRDVVEVLRRPLDPDVALSVPLRPGRKHLLPSAQWGHVQIDDVSLTWTRDDAARLAAVEQLTACGVRVHQLTDPAPRWTVLAPLTRADRLEVVRQWRQLDIWRRRQRPWLQLAIVLAKSMTPVGAL